MHYAEVVRKTVEALKKPDYLEIGVLNGDCFFPVQADRKIAVDPEKKINRSLSGNETFHEMTSDHYFATTDDTIDGVIFIDGLHEFRQVIRDVENSLEAMTDESVIILDDSNPTYETQATPAMGIKHAKEIVGDTFDWSWCGDVWKAIALLRLRHDDLNIFTLRLGTGLTFITRGNPENSPSQTEEEILAGDYEYFSERRNELINLKHGDYFHEWIKDRSK